MAMVAEEESASAAVVVTPRRLHTSPVHPSGPHRGLVSAAAASWRPRRASHHITRRWHFGSSGLVLPNAPLRADTSLQLKRPTVASMHLEHSTIEEAVSPETGIIPEIVSKTAAQTPRASMSLPGAQPIGTTIGTGITTISGMAIVAVSLTANGSSTTLDSIPTIIRIPTDTPYDDYAYDYYPSGYNAGVYEGDADYYNPAAYDSSDQSTDSTIAAAQEQLARQGYYRGEIDGVFGPETRRAIVRYQSDHGLGVTGSLNTDTLHALGLPGAANN
jgi:Putative peptidoglycan binding domain